MLRVVKLGGSLHRAPELADCLKAIVHAGEGVVVVPGGGPFADTIRTVQAQSGISDATAHHMAMLAMEQYGLMLCELEPNLVPVDSMEKIATALSQGHTPIWQPVEMCRNAEDIPKDWSVTSDSLAAWLAIKLAAESLILIKHACPADTGPVAMAVSGYVDKAFPFFASKFGGTIHVLDIHEANTITSWLMQPA
ncbi:MAG: amino acid kinase family protein [Thiobacillus sp.]